MTRIATWKISACCLLLAVPFSVASVSELEQVDNPNVRMTKHDDGSKTIYTRTPDRKTITQKTFTAGGVLSMVRIYRMDENENPRSCKIFDGQNNELFKVSYGYSRTDGQLREERMFDSRTKRINPADGTELPVHRVMYEYDGQGRRSAPISITLIPGRTAEDVFGRAPSGLLDNPFKDPAVKPANPNARPVGKGN